MAKLLTILTIRNNSDRLPGKILAPIASRDETNKPKTLPLAVWVLRRLRRAGLQVIIAATDAPTDNEVVEVFTKEDATVHRWSTGDVIGQMQDIASKTPADFIFRALGDCPFLSTRLVKYATETIAAYRRDAFVYHLPPDSWPVYGAREFPYSMQAWGRIVAESRFREHPDQYFHQNRRGFNILYHQPPDTLYFRPYRLEVDWQEDLDMVRIVGANVGMLAPLSEVIRFLDNNPDVASINASHNEKTGPTCLTTYDVKQRRYWLSEMTGQKFLTWTGKWISPPDKKAQPIFCNCGGLLGWGLRGQLNMADGSVMDAGFPRCGQCGLLMREWKRAIGR